MIDLGIFAKTFLRNSIDEVFAAVRQSGFKLIHFNMSCTGLESMPTEIPMSVYPSITSGVQRYDLRICALSGTFNMAHPDPSFRRDGLNRLEILARTCKRLNIPCLSLCTGTRNLHDKWTYHSENDSKEAWLDMCSSISKAIQIAEKYDVFLGIEPEFTNVVSSVKKAKSLLIEMLSDRLKIILDPANLCEPPNTAKIKSEIDLAFDLLGDQIHIVHAKDRDPTGQVITPGHGIIPFQYLINKMMARPESVPLIIHGVDESEVILARMHLQKLINGF